MRLSYQDHPELKSAVFELLDLVFPGISGAEAAIRALGGDWAAVSTPFVQFQEGRPVSHVGLIELPLVLDGRAVRVGSVHAVATHPDFRRRGYYRLLLEELFDFCRGRFETLILTTSNPEYYRPFGFEMRSESCFSLPVTVPGRADGMRRLDLTEPEDLALAHRLVSGRQPVSKVLGVGGEWTVFLFNERRQPLFYAEDLDVMVALKLENRRLSLFDIVGPRLPVWSGLLARLPGAAEEISFFFSPDLLKVKTSATALAREGGDTTYLMTRGPFLPPGIPFILPPSART